MLKKLYEDRPDIDIIAKGRTLEGHRFHGNRFPLDRWTPAMISLKIFNPPTTTAALPNVQGL